MNRFRRTFWIVPIVLSTLMIGRAAAQSPGGAVRLSVHPRARQILERDCFACHGGGEREGNLALDSLLAKADPQADRAQWIAVWQNLRAQTMPPADQKQPAEKERRGLIAWIEKEVFRFDPANPDPGRVTIRRLNRGEYQNTIRDLLGVDFKAADAFPADDTGYGFDTIGDVLSVSPLLLEKYVEAAQTIVAKVVPGGAAASGAAASGAKSGSSEYQRVFFEGPPPADAARRSAYARTVVRRFADRAFRRPVDDPTLERLVAMVDAKSPASFERSVGFAMVAVLASPRFLFRAEVQPSPNDAGIVVPLDDFALASRLSYFLWSSMPDDELFALARQGKVRAELGRQVVRMLSDPKSNRFVENFVGQWLRTRDVETMPIDPRRALGAKSKEDANALFPRGLRPAMRRETEMLFAHLLREDGRAVELLAADYTFLNEALAKWYGIPGVKGDKMRKVDLPSDSPRGGLLTHGSFLLVTSNPTRTSPVKRGLFVLDNILGTPAPPPPADVPPLEDVLKGQSKKLSMRELMELHRKDALCASCHARMDPLGLAMEHFNALGGWRAKDGAEPIETAGELITGETFADARALGRVIAAERRGDFHRCLTEKLLTYALGRGVEYYDAPSVDRIVEQAEKDGGKLSAFVTGVVASAPFQMRRGDGTR